MVRMPVKLEYLTTDVTIIEETVIDEKTGDKVMVVEAKWQQADIVNINKRKYPKALLQREIDRLAPRVLEGSVYGASYHPRGGDAEVDDVSHIWVKSWMEKDGTCVGHAKILPTARGKNAQVLIKHGGRIGVSSRGHGTVTSKTETIKGENISFDEVNDDFRLKSFGDFVLTPSVPGAGVRRLIESQIDEIDDSDFNYKDEKQMNIANVEELQKAFPELVQSVKDEAAKAGETVAKEGLAEEIKKQVAEALEAKKEEWKTEMNIDGITAEITELKKDKDSTIDAIRGLIITMSDLPGVVGVDEEDDKEGKDNKVADVKVEDSAIKQKIADLEAKNKTLQDQIAADKKVKEDEKIEKELQIKLRTGLDEELKKEEHIKYAALIEKDLVSDGKILLDSVDKISEAVLNAKTKINDTLVLAEQEKIISGGIEEKGKIENPEGGDVKSLTEDEITARWERAREAGGKLSLEEYKEKVLKMV